MMGFPLNLAKNALISVKNSSVDAAIEKMLILQDEEKKNSDNMPAQENLTMIKPLWICSLCTLENESIPNQEPMCEACGSPPGIAAYYTAEEIEVIRAEEMLQLNAQKEEEEKKRQEQLEKVNEYKEDSEVKALIESSVLDNIRFEEILGQNIQSFFTRFFVFSSFYDANKKKSVLRIKRFAYSENYLKSLILTNADSKKSMSYLGGNILYNTEELESLATLLKNRYQLQLDSMISLFGPNEHDQVLTECCSFDLKLDNKKVVDIVVSNNSLQDGFWMILEDLSTKQVSTKHYKFSDIKGGDYARTEFGITEASLEFMDTGESYPQSTDLEVSGLYKVLQKDGNLY